MYVIQVDGKTLYAPNLIEDGYSVISPKLTLELNKAGSLTFTIPPNNPMYDSIQKLKSVVTVYQDSEEIFRGRVLHDEKDYYRRKEVYCEGELSFLLDSIQRPYSFTGDVPELFKQFLDNHNNQVDSWKQFKVGNVTVKDSNNYINRSSTGYSNTLDELNDKLISTHGGYLKKRIQNGENYLDYLEESGSTNSQVIEFGKNLLNISEYISADEVFTVLIPLGAEQTDKKGNSTGRLTIKSVNDGKDYIENSLGISLFGRITKYQEWDDVTVAKNLLTKGKAFLNAGIGMSVALTLKAVDLHLIDVETESIHVGDKIRVVSIPHSIDSLFQCSKIDLNLVEPGKSEYTFGSSFKALTEKNVDDAKAIYKTTGETVQKVEEVKNTVTLIGDKMTKEELFKILTNDGQIQGLYQDEETGDIYINASYIRSGILTIGGENAKLQIINGEGIVCVEADESGIKILQGEVNATSGTLDNMSVVEGITISTRDNDAMKNLSLVKIVETETGSGTAYCITFGELTGRSTPIAIEGSSIRIQASSGITFSADNIIFENAIEVNDIYVNKDWTALKLKNSLENKGFEAKQLEYRRIGNHVYIRGSVNFPSGTAWSGSSVPVADLPTLIKPTQGNIYRLNACSGSRVARVIATATGGLSIEWIKKLSDGSNDTTTTGMWIDMNVDYWVD